MEHISGSLLCVLDSISPTTHLAHTAEVAIKQCDPVKVFAPAAFLIAKNSPSSSWLDLAKRFRQVSYQHIDAALAVPLVAPAKHLPSPCSCADCRPLNALKISH